MAALNPKPGSLYDAYMEPLKNPNSEPVSPKKPCAPKPKILNSLTPVSKS